MILLGGLVSLLLAGAAALQLADRHWIAGAVLLALAVAVVVAAFGVLEQQRRRSLRGRVHSFLEEPRADPTSRQGDDGPAPPRTAKQTAIERLAPEADIAGIEGNLGGIFLAMVAGGLFFGIVVAIVVSSPWGLLAALVAPVVMRSVVKRRAARTRKRFEQQLPDNLDVVSSALRVGHSLGGAFAVTVEAADEPSRSELGRAIAEEQLGVPLDVALRHTAARMQSRDLDQVALVARLQRDAGTNAAEVIDQVSENIRGRMDLERLVRTLTAQGRMARWIVSAIPFFLFAAMFLLNREYLQPLWQTPLGRAGMVLGLIMILTGSFVIKKIVEIEV